MVTETAQYSALHCFFNFKQNNEYLLISNTLRFICSILLALAFYFILHCARHSYASLLLENGVDIYTIKSLMGHTNVKTTQIYTHLVNEQKEKAANTLYIENLDL
ncbi:tyrosine-type recombinase/integrase [Bacteroides uniformis]|nr:tyrosine-type recombinase/integrase [Bacteroides uniformis]